MLSLKNVHVYYGAIHALKGISFDVTRGEIVTLIGSNGAGKSTCLKTISGLLRPKEGSLRFKENDLTVVSAPEIVSRGISQVPEGRRIFANMTVSENLDLGAYLRKDKAGIKEDIEKVFSLFPRLKERRRQLAGTLSGGEQQMLAMGRALMSKPELLLLDEPSMGLAPILVKQIFEIIQEINSLGRLFFLLSKMPGWLSL
jgi:branched-chain amino acid transport system ATP-binding protein